MVYQFKTISYQINVLWHANVKVVNHFSADVTFFIHLNSILGSIASSILSMIPLIHRSRLEKHYQPFGFIHVKDLTYDRI